MTEQNGQFICGDALTELRKLTVGSIDMCLTSPPYWGLRDYGIEQIFGGDKDCKHRWDGQIKHDIREKRKHGKTRTTDRSYGEASRRFDGNHQKHQSDRSCIFCGAWHGQLGLEPNPELYIEHMTEIFNEIKRVLKKEGTLWLNIGDSYSGGGFCGSQKALKGKQGSNRGSQNMIGKALNGTLPQKCMLMIPERLAWSLIQDGWILRNKIIWYKPNAMPSSVKDRLSNRWEYLFMFSKNQHYYFDLDGIREPHKYDGRKDTMYKGGPKDMQIGAHERWPDPVGKNPGDIIADRKWNDVPGQVTQAIAQAHGGWFKRDGTPIVDFEKGKNPGDFWDISTQPFPMAHFAVFPESLCEKPIKAGCPEFVCRECGKPRKRITKTDYIKNRPSAGNDKRSRNEDRLSEARGHGGWRGNNLLADVKTIGWTKCKCKAGFEPGVVLDPFAGAGTVGVVAKSLGRRFILMDIKEDYIKMAKKRVVQIGHQKELFE